MKNIPSPSMIQAEIDHLAGIAKEPYRKEYADDVLKFVAIGECEALLESVSGYGAELVWDREKYSKLLDTIELKYDMMNAETKKRFEKIHHTATGFMYANRVALEAGTLTFNDIKW